MWPYWVLFGVNAIPGLLSPPRREFDGSYRLIIYAMAVVMALFPFSLAAMNTLLSDF